ncbi:MAG TPA: LapA family protein [Solirubrobacteraceae bacterium]
MTEGTSSGPPAEPPLTSNPLTTSTSPGTEAQPPAKPEPAPTTKTGVAFGGLIAGAIVLILLLVFILENTASVKISYFGVGGHVPLGVALLLAAIGGALVTGIVGAARIVQLRRHLRRRPRG